MYNRQAAVALLAGLAAVSAKNCVDLNVSITATARNGVFNIPEPASNIDVTNFVLDGNQPGINGTAAVLQGYATVSGNYTIAATYCEPDSGPSDILQILTHGIGADRSYWDLPYNNYNYSYAVSAVDKYGYSTFAYDRLGIGQSSIGDPVNEIQAWLEVGALASLTNALRAGTVAGISTAYETVVHIGHSFGSGQTYALTAMYPDISDGVVLTGFSQNGSFIPYFAFASSLGIANQLSPAFADLPNGYLASQDQSAVQYDFLGPGQFDPNILPFLYQNGQPVTFGELLTIGGIAGSINNFAGPVLIINGDRDIPFCGGNCLAPPAGYSSIPSTSSQFLPNAKPFQVDLVSGSGHGLNFQYTAQYTYDSIAAFLSQNGLAPSGGSPAPPSTTTSGVSPTAYTSTSATLSTSYVTAETAKDN